MSEQLDRIAVQIKLIEDLDALVENLEKIVLIFDRDIGRAASNRLSEGEVAMLRQRGTEALSQYNSAVAELSAAEYQLQQLQQQI
jgi:uncharacterized membrane protein